MTESTRLIELVQSRIDGFVSDRESIVSSISPDLTPFIGYSRQFLSAGKRFRALFCYWGWRSASSGSAGWEGPDAPSAEPVIAAAAALEVFHAAALAHDDIIDKSDTRRGSPSAHRLFEGHHPSQPPLSAAAFGVGSAILFGDLLLGWSDELLDLGLDQLGDYPTARRSRAVFNRMRTEVTAGQYLDILEELAWSDHPDTEAVARAETVITYKSAKYSIQAPLLLGATMAGATEATISGLEAFGLPLGIAYQLRDDLLGVFGDPAVTGKPSGDDLREGKRTVLIALARENLSPADRAALDAGLGDTLLSDDRISVLQQMIRDSGAVARVEELIGDRVRDALSALSSAPLLPDAQAQLRSLAEQVTRRQA